jgi:ketosteroid isomerase-like protein
MSDEENFAPEHTAVTPEEFVEAIRAGELVNAMRAGYQAFSEGGLDMSVFHADAEWHQRPEIPDARICRGREEIARMSAEFSGSFEDFRAEPLELVELDGKIVAVVRVSGRVRGTEHRVEMTEVHVWRFRDGLISEVREYLTKDEALQALGPQAGGRIRVDRDQERLRALREK